MQIGLLWFDNNPDRELAAKIEDAARRYRDKFGLVPDTCYVNQAAVEVAAGEAGRVERVPKNGKPATGPRVVVPEDLTGVSAGATPPRELLVSFGDAKGRSIRVVPAGNVLPHHFWIGVEADSIETHERSESVFG